MPDRRKLVDVADDQESGRSHCGDTSLLSFLFAPHSFGDTITWHRKTPKPEEMIVIDVIRENAPAVLAGGCRRQVRRDRGLQSGIPKITGRQGAVPRACLSYKIANSALMLPKHDRLVSQIVGLERGVLRAAQGFD